MRETEKETHRIRVRLSLSSGMEAPAMIWQLPHDTLSQILSLLPLPALIRCRLLSKSFLLLLSPPSPFLSLLSPPPLPLLSLRPPHRHVSPDPSLHSFHLDQWLRFPLSFLPFSSPHPVASSHGLLYLWAQTLSQPHNHKILISCNPLTKQYRVLPQLGSAWSKHGSVLVGPPGHVIVLTELAALYFSPGSNNWVNFSSNLPSKPRSPILLNDAVLSLCDVGSPWRSQWKLFSCKLSDLRTARAWAQVEKPEWGDVFDILKRPRLVRGVGNRVLMIGGLRSSFSLNSTCSTILILRLDLDRMEWEEAGRMPVDMFGCFSESSSKFKVFGGGERVGFSGKRVGRRLALWEKGEWRWVDGIPGGEDGGLCRGFLFEARIDAVP